MWCTVRAQIIAPPQPPLLAAESHGCVARSTAGAARQLVRAIDAGSAPLAGSWSPRGAPPGHRWTILAGEPQRPEAASVAQGIPVIAGTPGSGSGIPVAEGPATARIADQTPPRSNGMPLIVVLIRVVLLLAMTAFWISQPFDLMASPDDRFPGTYDKVVWAAVMIVWPVLGSLTCWMFMSRLIRR